MKEIQLTQGKVALVDDEDFEYLSQWKWSAHKVHNVFYAVHHKPRNLGAGLIGMHRELMGKDGIIIDHINGNGLDNRKNNLRVCTNAQNLQNRGVSTKNTSGYKGVFLDKRKNKWYAQIGANNKRITGKGRITPEAAAKDYDILASKYHKEFASLNFKD